jgi:hypothetical protein
LRLQRYNRFPFPQGFIQKIFDKISTL